MKKLAIVMILAGALVACGGGGSNDSGTSALVFNADAAFALSLTNGVSLTGLVGNDAGRAFTASFAFAPAADTVFAGVLRKRSAQTVSLSTPGITTQTTVAQFFYTTGPAKLIGSTQTGSYIEYVSRGNLPVAGNVGQSGAFADAAIFTSSTKLTQVGTVAISWSIEADTATTAFACLTSVTSGSAQTTEKDCFKINSAGAILGGRISLTAPGINLTLQ